MCLFALYNSTDDCPFEVPDSLLLRVRHHLIVSTLRVVVQRRITPSNSYLE